MSGGFPYFFRMLLMTLSTVGWPIIAQAPVPVLDGDDEASLSARILVKEHELLPMALRWMAEGRVEVVRDGPGKRARTRVKS